MPVDIASTFFQRGNIYWAKGYSSTYNGPKHLYAPIMSVQISFAPVLEVKLRKQELHGGKLALSES